MVEKRTDQPETPAYLYLWINFRTAAETSQATTEILAGRAALITKDKRPEYIINEVPRYGTTTLNARPEYIIDSDAGQAAGPHYVLPDDTQARPQYIIDENGLAHLGFAGTLNLRAGVLAETATNDSGEFRIFMLPPGTSEEAARGWIGQPEAESFAKSASMLMRIQLKLR